MGNHAMYNVGYPLFILYQCFRFWKNLFAARIFNALLGGVAVLLCYVVAKEAGASKSGRLLAALAWAVYLPASVYPSTSQREFADSDNAFRIHVRIAFAETTERSICCLLRHPLWLTGFGWECRAFFGWRISSQADDRTSPFQA